MMKSLPDNSTRDGEQRQANFQQISGVMIRHELQNGGSTDFQPVTVERASLPVRAGGAGCTRVRAGWKPALLLRQDA
jgi:hypothetical protein